MKLWARVLLGYFLVVGIAGWFVLRVFVAEVKPGVREAVEDVMVDSVNLIAELAAREIPVGRTDSREFARSIEAYRHREVRASIWGREKNSLDFRVYVTDARGIVIYDSEGIAVGQDYSQWKDVAHTLKGQYGARSTRSDPSDDTSGVMYVAAPILDGNRIVGVATLAKPVAALAPIIERSERSVFRHGILLIAVTLFIGSVFTIWLTLSFARLLEYARALSRGEKAEPPSRGRDEFGELSRALTSMREELDGRAYVERYVQHLTHEMKSPLAAIHGAAELLAEPLEEAQRKHFARNIAEQGVRLRQMIDRLLRLAQLEQQRHLDDVQSINLPVFLRDLLGGVVDSANLRGVTVEWQVPKDGVVKGDPFLLGQAILNLVENAIAFTPQGGRVEIGVEYLESQCLVTVLDTGPGIPDYALHRLYERFFSLPRPDGAPKSTGLGLTYVREIMHLHGGSVIVTNRVAGGVAAKLILPL